MSKIQRNHLERAAYVYVRQSTSGQVEHNLESQRRQYGLAGRAKELGWHDIRVIDEDLGRSGSGYVERRGFETLLSEVCSGKAGAVFAIEASRLARNGHDWHRLLEFCQIVDTLIVDHDGVYDPKHPNDRLILGLKGTMSEVELSMFRQRSQEAVRQKAQRGEYFTRIAEGYVLGEDGRWKKTRTNGFSASLAWFLRNSASLAARGKSSFGSGKRRSSCPNVPAKPRFALSRRRRGWSRAF